MSIANLAPTATQVLPELPGEATNGDAFPAWPYFAEDEVEAATAVLRSGKVNYWTGTEGRRFESEFARFVDCRYAVAVANGTVALELALRGLGVAAGDEVIVPSRTFIATASAVVAVGARPVFADVDRDSQCITAATIAPLISPATRGVIPVHLGGWPCDMDPINELAKANNLFVLEDCSQAHGATYKGRPVGSLGHAAAFSFCQDKIMTTAGEGGMVSTNDQAVWEKMWSYKDHGKTFEPPRGLAQITGFRWVHHSFGTNWRLTEVQSSIGRLQLQKLPQWLITRRDHARYLADRLTSQPALRIPATSKTIAPSWYRFYAFLRPSMLRPRWDRDRIVREIVSRGVPCGSGTCSEVYLENAFPARWRPAERHPVARSLGETSLAFPVHPTLGRSHIIKICEVVETVLSQATQLT